MSLSNPIKICPWLGSIQDRDTAYSYPSPENFCYREKSDYRPSEETQTRLCLVAAHIKCPLYVESSPRTQP